MDKLPSQDDNYIKYFLNIDLRIVRRNLKLGRNLSDENIIAVIKKIESNPEFRHIYVLLKTFSRTDRKERPITKWKKAVGIKILPESTFAGIKSGLQLIFVYSSDKEALNARILLLRNRIENLINPKEKDYEQ
jgi:hypothetical protein